MIRQVEAAHDSRMDYAPEGNHPNDDDDDDQNGDDTADTASDVGDLLSLWLEADFAAFTAKVLLAYALDVADGVLLAHTVVEAEVIAGI